MDSISADEKRRRAITAWWERQTLRDFIARKRGNPSDQSETTRKGTANAN